MNTVTAVIVAAGSSTRMEGIDKQLALIDNVPVIARTALAFQNSPVIDHIVIVTRNDLINTVEDIVKEYNISKVVSVTNGGNTRAQSVIKGINMCPKADYIAIHDGARPFVSAESIEKTVNAAFKYGAAALAQPAKDTVKTVDKDNFIVSTVDRNSVRLMQTPQVFKKSVYLEALLACDNPDSFTDDCMLMESAGYKVKIIDSDSFNMKITLREDLETAGAVIRGKKND
ncbi:MAG: 2-C-methyl-D-erythritol 4-phosphate cytidylyltransferase [Clostridiales bacterium]|nr:2-C-methyl-D-erythritol 4-phosphate cytidylyltransferase [Clostridiales bacterium]